MQIRFQIEKKSKFSENPEKKFISHQELTEQIKQFGMFEKKKTTIRNFFSRKITVELFFTKLALYKFCLFLILAKL